MYDVCFVFRCRSCAFARQQFENRLIAKALREEGQIIKEALELEKQTELDSRKAMAEEVRQVRESAPKEAARRVLDSRVKQRNAIKEQSRRNAEQVAKVRAEEQKRKVCVAAECVHDMFGFDVYVWVLSRHVLCWFFAACVCLCVSVSLCVTLCVRLSTRSAAGHRTTSSVKFGHWSACQR